MSAPDLEGRAFVRRGGALRPADLFAEEYLETVKEGQQVLLTGRKPRNIQHHRLLFALLRVVVSNSPKWADEKVLLDDLKLATGLFETRVSAINGLPYPVPASISFAAMDQTRFKAWFEKALEVLARDVLGVGTEELRAEVSALLGDTRGP